eukprot:TRINITY_DN65775_c0_g1_i1.p1 TRINITY_DN65775_c0_g1~~TRINITY_DN65775_c0_g1_i1.p1  ORF type:complete len:310 (-),score=28.73 TRINITY_DN65775_c0_g1_i1:56-892(-)
MRDQQRKLVAGRGPYDFVAPIEETPRGSNHCLNGSDCDRGGFGHLETLGHASASWGLISTLVFSLCISCLSAMSETQVTEAPIKTIFICLATAFSTYTTCYSLLEFYYIQMILGVNSDLDDRPNMDKDILLATRRHLVAEVRAIFATFNGKRSAARNAMWMGLLCLIVSSMTQVNPFQSAMPTMSSSATAGTFFGSFLLIVGPAWYATRTRDFLAYCFICIAGLLAATVDVMLVCSAFPTAKLVAFLILLSTVIAVPILVLAFRAPLIGVVQQHVRVY